MKLHLIMPMGGGGTRFGNQGYELPKPLIEIYGKPFFYWATRSISKFVDLDGITFVVLADHVKHFHIDREILKYFPDAEIIVISEVLPGAVLTCMAGVKNLPQNQPILFNDCDHLFLCDSFYRFCEEEKFEECDGALITFKSNDTRFSYAAYNENGLVSYTVEKKVVSEDAICGAYYFRSRNGFENAVKEYLETCQYTEYFVSGVYNELVKAGGIIKTFSVDEHVSFGTPEEYMVAQENQVYKELC